MPELPEVEIIKRGLEKYLVGHMVENIEILDPLRFSGNPRDILGKKVKGIRRRGKGLIIVFESDISLAIHVKMTGQLIYQGEKTHTVSLSSKVGALPNKHTHVIFHLDHNAYLYYNDIRRFGWMKIVKTNELHTIPFFKSLGPEPFEDLTISHLHAVLKKSGSPVKSVLMDQTKIAGVGNIYANDALYEAGVNPSRAAHTLTKDEIEKLFHALHAVMSFSIEHGAASDTNYVDALGQDGRYQEHFRVYGQAGKACKKCGNEIVRTVIGGRSSFFCPVCQK